MSTLNKLVFAPTKRLYYGRIIILVAAINLFFSGPGQTYSISVFIDSYIKDFGWSRSMVSSMYSTATLIAGLLLFIVGRSIDKYGHRFMSVTIAALLGVACMWSSFITNLGMLFIGFFMLRLFGQGSMTLLPSTLVPQWFIKKRATALSLMSLGGVAASAVLPPLNIYIIDNWGWDIAWRVWTILLWFLFIPIAYIFIHNKPENIGLLPDDNIITLKGKNRNKNNKCIDKETHEISWTLKEAMQTRAFWLIMFCQAIPSMIITGVTFHFVSIMGQQGLDRTLAAFILSIVAMVSFPITFITGFILDKIKAHFVIAGLLVTQLISLLILLNTHTAAMAIVYGVTMGMVMGSQGVCNNVIWANYYGREYLGSIRGFSMMSIIVGSAFGPLPFGFAFDYFGGYGEIISTIAIIPLLGIVSALISPPPKKEIV